MLILFDQLQSITHLVPDKVILFYFFWCHIKLGHKDSVTFCGYNSSNKYLCTADMSGTVQVWAAGDGKHIINLETADVSVSSAHNLIGSFERQAIHIKCSIVSGSSLFEPSKCCDQKSDLIC